MCLERHWGISNPPHRGPRGLALGTPQVSERGETRRGTHRQQQQQQELRGRFGGDTKKDRKEASGSQGPSLGYTLPPRIFMTPLPLDKPRLFRTR